MFRLVVALLLVLSAPAAAAGKRIALVIGNAAYEEAGPLANPVNDARDMADALRAIGFTVIEGTDLDKRALERKVGEFADALPGADVGLFFYAGHGIQVDGRNYLLPTDARLDVPSKLRLEAVPIDDVIDIVESQATISLVFLDACRNNPFPAGAASRGATTLGSGLAQFDAARGSFIAFSTAPGTVALDGAGRNSPFAEALLRHIAVPGQGIADMMIAVRNDVMAQTRGTQRPWDQSALTTRFEFVPAPGAAAAASPPAAPQVAAVETGSSSRSLGAAASIETLIRRDYLAPDAADIAGTVGRLYAEPARIYGVPYERYSLVRLKQSWFAAYRAWELTLEADTLRVSEDAAGRAFASFDMRYDYTPKDEAQARQRGRARVHLELASTPHGWRIVSETSEALP